MLFSNETNEIILFYILLWYIIYIFAMDLKGMAMMEI